MAHIVAPSILSADFSQLGQAVDMLNRSQAGWIHVDVMDGMFVPNISFGFPVLRMLKPLAQKPLDVHLMIVQPERYITAFAEAGANWLTVHPEASIHLHRTLSEIRKAGMKCGIALNPSTPVSSIEDVIGETDLVLLMSVNPGFGGQKFIPNSLDKCKRLKDLILAKNSPALIEIDGGVDFANACALVDAGADVLVAGNTVFSAPSPIDAIAKLAGV